MAYSTTKNQALASIIKSRTKAKSQNPMKILAIHDDTSSVICVTFCGTCGMMSPQSGHETDTCAKLMYEMKADLYPANPIRSVCTCCDIPIITTFVTTQELTKEINICRGKLRHNAKPQHSAAWICLPSSRKRSLKGIIRRKSWRVSTATGC